MFTELNSPARAVTFVLVAALTLGSACMKRIPVAREPLPQAEVGSVLYVTTVDRREFKIKVTTADSTGIRGTIRDVRYRGEKMDRSRVGTGFEAGYSEIIDVEKGLVNQRAIIYSLVGLGLVSGVVWFVFGQR